jgi:hypothetical protein
MTGSHTAANRMSGKVHTSTNARWNLCSEDCLLFGSRSYFPNDTQSDRVDGEIQKSKVRKCMQVGVIQDRLILELS